jgi:hypothetical protein
MTDKRLFVGVHPSYQRTKDVLIQTALARPELHNVSTLDELANQAITSAMWSISDKESI